MHFISRACESLDAEGLTLHWQRADEIARPGKITEQLSTRLRPVTRWSPTCQG